jgi:hypothetical protein
MTLAECLGTVRHGIRGLVGKETYTDGMCNGVAMLSALSMIFLRRPLSISVTNATRGVVKNFRIIQPQFWYVVYAPTSINSAYL